MHKFSQHHENARIILKFTEQSTAINATRAYGQPIGVLFISLRDSPFLSTNARGQLLVYDIRFALSHTYSTVRKMTDIDMLDALVQRIHDSDMFGVFSETGAGCPVVSALYGVSGASRTILASFQPYCKGTAPVLLNTTSLDENIRTVSKEHVAGVCDAILMRWKNASINTAFASSFQVGNDTSTVTHGWVAISYKNKRRYFHLTLRHPNPPHEMLNRRQQIEQLGNTCIGVLQYMLNKSVDALATYECVHIDGVFDENGSNLVEALQILSHRHPMDQDGFLVIDPSGQLVRLEALCRDQRRLVLFKGSFNPPTVEHVRLFSEATSTSDPKAAAFMISINTVDKGQVNVADIARRVDLINKLGISCMVNLRGHFAPCIRFFNATFPTVQLCLPVGSDTWERIEPELRNEAERSFLVFPRTNCSSTEVRNLLSIPSTERTIEQHSKIIELIPCVLRSTLLNPI